MSLFCRECLKLESGWKRSAYRLRLQTQKNDKVRCTIRCDFASERLLVGKVTVKKDLCCIDLSSRCLKSHLTLLFVCLVFFNRSSSIEAEKRMSLHHSRHHRLPEKGGQRGDCTNAYSESVIKYLERQVSTYFLWINDIVSRDGISERETENPKKAKESQGDSVIDAWELWWSSVKPSRPSNHWKYYDFGRNPWSRQLNETTTKETPSEDIPETDPTFKNTEKTECREREERETDWP